jgi:hypothetical protein
MIGASRSLHVAAMVALLLHEMLASYSLPYCKACTSTGVKISLLVLPLPAVQTSMLPCVL